MRLVFVLLAPWQFLGVFVYGVLWLVLPLEQPAEAPGLEAASRTGLRQADPQTRRADLGAIVALIMLAGGRGLVGRGRGGPRRHDRSDTAQGAWRLQSKSRAFRC